MIRGRCALRGVLLASVSVLGIGLNEASGAVTDYPDGSTNSSPIVLTDNSTQLRVLTGSATQSGVISQRGGSWGLEKIGTGTLILTGNNTYTGGTTISAGTLQLGNGGAGSITGNVTDNGALVVNGLGASVQAISGSGSVSVLGTSALILSGNSTYTGGTTIGAGAILQLGGLTAGTSGSMTGDVTDNGTLLVNKINTNTILAGSISGSGSLWHTSSATTLILTGNNTYTGGTTISSSGEILQIGNGGTSGNIAGDVIDNYELYFDRSDALTFTGVISGTGEVRQLGSGVLTLSGASTYTGGTTISAGTLQVGNGGTTGSVTGNIVDNGTLSFNRNDSVTYGNVVSGSGSLIQAGTGTLILTNTNSYTGGTTISAGTLQIGNGSNSGSISGNVVDDGALVFMRQDFTLSSVISGSGSLVQLQNNTLTLTGNNTFTGPTIISAGAIQLGNGGTTGSVAGNIIDNHELDVRRSDDVAISNIISGSGLVFVLGSGTTTLAGTNSYTGGTVIATATGGALSISSDSNLGNTSDPNNYLRISGGNILQITSSGSFMDPIYVQGATNFGGASVIRVLPNVAVTWSGPIVDEISLSAASLLQIAGGGTFAPTSVSAATTPYNGHGMIDGGYIVTEGSTLLIDNDQEFGTSAALLTLGDSTSSGTLQFGASITATHAITIGGGGGVIDSNGFTVTVSPPISGSALTKLGAGTLTLTGANTYTGGTTISAGTLQIGNGGSTGSIVGDVIDNGTLTLNRSDSIGFDGAISGGGNLVQAGSGQVTLTGANTYTGTTTISAGTLQIGNGGTSGQIGTGAVTDNGTLAFNRSDSLTVSAAIGGTGTLNQIGQGNTFLTGANSYTGQTLISGGTLVIGNGGTSGTLGSGDVTITNAATLGFYRSDTITVANAISGSDAGLAQAGPGTVILTGANNFTGVTTIYSGATLQIGNGGTTGSVDGNITDNGALIANRSDSVRYAGVISGTGAVSQSGGGILSLSATSTYTGATIVAAGTLEVNGSVAASSGVTVASGATLAGSGTVAATTIQSGAMLSPGAASGGIGILSVAGDLTLTAGSAYGVEVSSGAADKVAVTGAAGIAGTLFANFSGYTVNSPYAILTSTGTLSGTFASLNTLGLSGSGYHAIAGYDDHDVFLTVVRDTFIWSATPGSSDWNTAANWQTGAVPTAIDPVFFNATSNANITIGAAANAQSLQFNSGAPAYTFAITGTAASAASLTLSNSIGDNSGNAPTITVSGVSGHGGSLAFTGGGTAADAILVAGSFGTISFAGNADAGAAAQLAAQSGGTIDFSATSGVNADNKVTAGSIAGAGNFVLGADTLSVGALGSATEVSGVISGTGALTKTGTGTLTLSGTNTYTGGTTVSAGTLQIGNGGTSGAVTGNVVDNGVLAFNRADAVSFAGAISGTGAVTKAGGSTLTLSGNDSYTGGTTINAGTLNVTGTIGGVTAAGGATLTGTGKVGTTVIASGATLSPGAGASLGSLTVQGNLSLAAGATYLDYLTPSATSLTAVTGTAGLNGAVVANLASGSYAAGQRYTFLTASGGLSGSFASLAVSGLSTALKARLSYDANDAYLNFDPNAITPLLPSGATAIEKNLAGGIDAAIQGGATLNSGFTALFNLSGANLTAALDRIAGGLGADVSQAGSQSFAPFLALLTDQGGSDGTDGVAANYSPGHAYGAPDSPRPARLAPGEMRVWGAIYGSHGNLSANAVSGASALSAGAAGFAAGAERQLSDDARAGVSMGIGHDSFSSANGRGGSDDVMVAAYGHYAPGPGYLSGAIGYGWHDLTITRVVTVAGTDTLVGKPDTHEWAGRVEAGYALDLSPDYQLTPFAAFEGESVAMPGYTETALSGSANFALTYTAHTDGISHLELGSRLGHSFALGDGMLTVDGLAAWAHQLQNDAQAQAAFASLPGSTFTIFGVRPADESALLGLDVQMQPRSGLSYGVKVRGQLGAGTSIIAGTAILAFRW